MVLLRSLGQYHIPWSTYQLYYHVSSMPLAFPSYLVDLLFNNAIPIHILVTFFYQFHKVMGTINNVYILSSLVCCHLYFVADVWNCIWNKSQRERKKTENCGAGVESSCWYSCLLPIVIINDVYITFSCKLMLCLQTLRSLTLCLMYSIPYDSPSENERIVLENPTFIFCLPLLKKKRQRHA